MDSSEQDARAAKQLLQGGHPEEAIALLINWLADHGNDADAWTTLAACHFELEDWPQALSAARRVTELEPERARHWSNLGTVLRKLGELAEAERAQRHANAPGRRRRAPGAGAPRGRGREHHAGLHARAGAGRGGYRPTDARIVAGP